MNIAKKLILPGAVAAAGFLGVAGASLLTNIGADAASTSNGTSTQSTSQSGTPPGPHTANGITETVLTGDASAKAIAAAQKAEPGATVIRAETDADGAKYEVHMKKSDGSMVTVKLDASFNVTATEDGMGAGMGGPRPNDNDADDSSSSSSSSSSSTAN